MPHSETNKTKKIINKSLNLSGAIVLKTLTTLRSVANLCSNQQYHGFLNITCDAILVGGKGSRPTFTPIVLVSLEPGFKSSLSNYCFFFFKKRGREREREREKMYELFNWRKSPFFIRKFSSLTSFVCVSMCHFTKSGP